MGFYSIREDLHQIIIANTAPPSQNNERHYWLRKADKFCSEFTLWRAEELESRFGNLGLDPKDYGRDQGVTKDRLEAWRKKIKHALLTNPEEGINS